MASRVSLLLPFVAFAPFAVAQVSLPNIAQLRYVDFSRDLAHPSAVVAVGSLAKWKEGKRERLADGQLGGSGQVASVSGTQYFKVPVTATLQPRVSLHGKADGAVVTFDVQLARLPDGKERRQVDGGATLAEDTVALFVLVPRAKKGFELRHVIAFDPAADKDRAGVDGFTDTMRDWFTVNRRVSDLTAALEAFDGARDDAERKAALDSLRALLAKKPELKQPKNDGLLTQHAAPLEQRAQKRVDDAAKAEPPK